SMAGMAHQDNFAALRGIAPSLIMHLRDQWAGRIDDRQPSGGEAMFRALKYLRRPVGMGRFPGESHERSRSGRPSHRSDRLQHIVRWFDKYLQGVKTDLYDVP